MNGTSFYYYYSATTTLLLHYYTTILLYSSTTTLLYSSTTTILLLQGQVLPGKGSAVDLTNDKVAILGEDGEVSSRVVDELVVE